MLVAGDAAVGINLKLQQHNKVSVRKVDINSIDYKYKFYYYIIVHTDKLSLEGVTSDFNRPAAVLLVKPNPVSSLVNVIFDNNEETIALDYEIADKNGKVLLHGHWPVNKGKNKTIINLSLLSNGVYELTIRELHNDTVLIRQGIVKS